MIGYYLGEKKCKINFDDFLSLTFKDEILYKSHFSDFTILYEFIDKNKKHISHMIFDNNEYFMQGGVLHNLYGPAHIMITELSTPFTPVGTTRLYFYIDGRLVHDHINSRGCKKIGDFLSREIFFYEVLTNRRTGKDSNGNFYRKKANVDYIKTPIDLDERIRIDQRSKKIKKISLLQN